MVQQIQIQHAKEVAALKLETGTLKMETGKLQAALADAEEGLFLRNQPGKRIQYVLSDGTTGSFLTTLFDRIPAANIGIAPQDFQQVPTGRMKRVFIDCDVETWRHVHGFGRCGVIPDGLQPTLLAQARQWSIQPLVEALEARIPGIVKFERNGTGGFTAHMHFVGLDLCGSVGCGSKNGRRRYNLGNTHH